MFPDLLREQFPGLAPEVIAALHRHYDLMLRWNKVLNLTRLTGVKEAVERHYCESIFLSIHVPRGAVRIADIGSGAGFPGLPIALARPDCSVTLIESHQRKAVFLREAVREIRNLRILAKRAEDVNDMFDLVVSRAVSYRDLGMNLRRFAPRTMLLTGGEAPPDSLGLVWKAPVVVPWGDQRFLRQGLVPELADVEAGFT